MRSATRDKFEELISAPTAYNSLDEVPAGVEIDPFIFARLLARSQMQPGQSQGGMSQPQVPVDRQKYQQMVDQAATNIFGAESIPALNNLVMKESGFNPNAQNPTSTAHGMFQFLDSTWKGVGAEKTDDPMAQTAAGLQYIKNRYGTPQKAWEFHKQNGWY